MELNDRNRQQVRQFADRMLHHAAAGDSAAVNLIGGQLVAAHGAGGAAYAMYLWAEDVTAHTRDAARDPFRKVQPHRLLTEEDWQQAVARVTDGYALARHHGYAVPTPPDHLDPDAVLATLADYLWAVQRADPRQASEVIGTISGDQFRFDLFRDLLLALAASCSATDD